MFEAFKIFDKAGKSIKYMHNYCIQDRTKYPNMYDRDGKFKDIKPRNIDLTVD